MQYQEVFDMFFPEKFFKFIIFYTTMPATKQATVVAENKTKDLIDLRVKLHNIEAVYRRVEDGQKPLINELRGAGLDEDGDVEYDDALQLYDSARVDFLSKVPSQTLPRGDPDWFSMEESWLLHMEFTLQHTLKKVKSTGLERLFSSDLIGSFIPQERVSCKNELIAQLEETLEAIDSNIQAKKRASSSRKGGDDFGGGADGEEY